MILQITREEIQAATTRYLERGGQIQQIDKVVGEPIFGDDLILTEDVLEMIEVQESDLWSAMTQSSERGTDHEESTPFSATI